MEGDESKRPTTTFISRANEVVVNEGEEEKKMEEFFTLIQKIKALKDHCRKTSSSSSSSSERTKTGGSSTTSTTAWVPSFELEDFNQDVEFKPMPVVVVPPPPPTKVEEEKKRRVGDDMDLELRL
ncbi:hypothetical protein QJS04_geneDACA017650 [Acorus gramineus]|uniref:Uncharacterized protein n=1 Tax=Acorus gramineus TaxID=55184 RepID=A0AAV9AY45_ACOGR|nr:hypothetical protein QJS04_geneDACA017650 [Acorus gramineus]